MTQTPSIGRIVHYYTRDESRHANGMGEGPYAAIITQVFSDTCINCYVLPPFAAPYDSASVMPAEFGPESWWEWPPRV